MLGQTKSRLSLYLCSSHAELKAQVASKDKDLKTKDVEIAELKHRLHEQTDKNKSLEIDLEAERVKVATAEEAKHRAEEARYISTSALNVAQINYAEAQGIVDTLVSESEWMRNRGIALVSETVELSDEEESAGGDGNGDGDGDGDGEGGGDEYIVFAG
ncbi:hypothetical protein Hanom_Chr13g01188771 [Helianthus anomalus]